MVRRPMRRTMPTRTATTAITDTSTISYGRMAAPSPIHAEQAGAAVTGDARSAGRTVCRPYAVPGEHRVRRRKTAGDDAAPSQPPQPPPRGRNDEDPVIGHSCLGGT